MIVSALSNVYAELKPQIIYFPFKFDVHTDHEIVSRAVISTLKWFRHPYIRQVFMYETLSETDFNYIRPSFKPNYFVDITKFLKKKIDTIKVYD